MVMARKKRTFPGISRTVRQAAETFQEIERNYGLALSDRRKDYEILVERIVNTVENRKKLDILAYRSMIRQYPQTKKILDELIDKVRLFTVYDSEPTTINFDYSAYLKQIEVLALAETK